MRPSRAFARRSLLPEPAAAIATAVVLAACLASAVALAAAPESTELWGGPGAKGGGLFGAHFDTNIYITSTAGANATVGWYRGGVLLATRSAVVPAQGSIVVVTPDELIDKGAFLFHITSDAPVTAWSETVNITPTGQFGLAISTFTNADYLAPGDEANGGGADAATVADPGRSRTNVGVLCSPNSGSSCSVSVDTFEDGTLLGSGAVNAPAGAAAQGNLVDLVPGSTDHSRIVLRIRVLQGTGLPYAIKNHNDTSDAAFIPLAATRAAFSTAPTITSFNVDPVSGCAPQNVNMSWTTTGATRVTIAGATGNLPPNGSTTVSLVASTDLVLTAYSSTGQASTLTRHVTVLPPTDPPIVTPAEGNTIYNGILTGVINYASSSVTIEFLQHESTGSTFTLQGSAYTYKAGTTAGTDIVKITVNGVCGSASTTFTATVNAPGSPKILSFYSEPLAACGNANVTLNWVTENVDHVTLTGVPFDLPPNSAYGFTISTTTTYTLTAYGFNKQKVTATYKVQVDPSLQTAILTPNNFTVHPYTTTVIEVTGIDNPDYLSIVAIQRDSGGFLYRTGPLEFTYTAGPHAGTDIYRVYYRNGCGRTLTLFQGTVIFP